MLILKSLGYSAIETKVLRAISIPHHPIEIAHHAFARKGLRPGVPSLTSLQRVCNEPGNGACAPQKKQKYPERR